MSATESSGKADAADVSRSIIAHYERSLAEHGPTARGMDWKDDESQRLRYDILTAVCDLSGKAVHEIGAGAGHLYDHLVSRGVRVDYSGSDLSPRMVEAARRLHPGVLFEQRDALSLGPRRRYDVVICSGLFHVKLDVPNSDWRAFVESTIRGMYDTCRLAIAFNAMSDRVDFESPDLHYSSGSAMLEFCQRELSRHVVLRHDYPLYEYTLYVYREPRVQ
jgi:hypothetical protein